MRAMLLLAWRNLSSRPARTLLATSGVVLGVAMVMAIAITVRSVGKELAAISAGDAGGAALAVTPAAGERWLDESLAERIQTAAGVQKVLPQVLGGTVLAFDGALENVSFFAVNPQAEEGVGTYQIVAGKVPAASESPGVVLEEQWAKEHGFAPGSSVTIIFGPSHRVTWPVTGLIAREGLGRFNGGNLVLINLAHYQQAVEQPGNVNRFLVVADSNARDVLQAVSAVLPQGAEAWEAGSGGGNNNMITIGLSFFGQLAALVGAFLIYGSFSLSLRQRVAQTGMTVAVGGTARQVAGALLGEAVGVGVLGSAIGVALGSGLSVGMIRLVSNTMGGRQVGTVEIAWADALLALAVGLVVTLAAGILPVWRASRVSPLEAIRSRGATEGRRGYVTALIGLVIAGFCLAGWTWVFSLGNVLVAQMFTPGYYLGISLAIPLLVEWGVTYLLQPVARRLGAVPLLAAGNLSRNISRATLTVSAMMVSVAMLVGFSAITSSFWRGAEQTVESTMVADLVVSGDMSPEVLAALRQIPGIAALTPHGGRSLRLENGSSLEGRVWDPAEARKVLTFQLDEGDREEAFAALERGGAIVVSTNYARKYGIKLGDVLRVERRDARGPIPGSFAEMKVVGIMANNFNQGRIAHISFSDTETHFGGTVAYASYLKLEPGADPQAISAAIVEQFPRMSVVDAAASKEEMRQHLSSEMSAFKAILYIALIMSGLGIINTLAMSVVEQRRELGLLRAVGATAGQTGLTILVESLFLGLVGATLGLAAGSIFSVSFVDGAKQFMNFIAPYTFPLVESIIAFGLALLLSLGAALVPAWRAGRTTVVEALRAE